MRKTLLFAILLTAACGQGGGNTVIGNNQAEADAGAEAPPAPPPVQTATLVGLYEGAGNAPSQICITEKDGISRFGLVIRTREGVPGCGGAGIAVRTGGRLRLTMEGEASCVIDARVEGLRVSFPRQVPATCAYYCAPDAWAGGASFTKVGGTREDASRARDVVDDPLCG